MSFLSLPLFSRCLCLHMSSSDCPRVLLRPCSIVFSIAALVQSVSLSAYVFVWLSKGLVKASFHCLFCCCPCSVSTPWTLCLCGGSWLCTECSLFSKLHCPLFTWGLKTWASVLSFFTKNPSLPCSIWHARLTPSLTSVPSLLPFRHRLGCSLQNIPATRTPSLVLSQLNNQSSVPCALTSQQPELCPLYSGIPATRALSFVLWPPSNRSTVACTLTSQQPELCPLYSDIPTTRTLSLELLQLSNQSSVHCTMTSQQPEFFFSLYSDFPATRTLSLVLWHPRNQSLVPCTITA